MLELELQLHREDGFRLDLHLEAGLGYTVLYGPSGAGKSSLLDCIAGSACPQHGHIRLHGETLFDAAQGIDCKPRLRRTPRVYQDGRLFPHLSVRENLLYGAKGAAGLEELIGALEITELLDRYPRSLSGGQRQRVAVGRALLTEPRALLLDEPLASLDLPLRRRILPYLRGLATRFEIPFVYVTHSLEEALVLGRKVVILEAGKVKAAGSPGEVLAHGPDAPLAGVVAGDSLLEVVVGAHHRDEGITECSLGSARLRCLLLDATPGERIFLALSSRDVLLANEMPRALSARNLIASRVRGLTRLHDHVEAELSFVGAPDKSPTVTVSLTPQACEELEVREGSELVAIFKASALRPITTAFHLRSPHGELDPSGRASA